jgi:hypothetical protein
MQVPTPEEMPNTKPANSLNSAQKRIRPDQQHVSGYKESNQGEHHDVSQTDVHLINRSPQSGFVPAQRREEERCLSKSRGVQPTKKSPRQRVAQASALVDLRLCEAQA